MKCDIVVVGAGLAGLACARQLQKSGIHCIVVEASDAPGGRIRTDRVEGFLLDRGFQVLLTAYPAAERELNLEGLDLRSFQSGALIRKRNRFERISDPMRDPLGAPATLSASVGSFRDKLRMLPLRRKLGRLSVDDIFSRPEMATHDAIRSRWRFSDRMIRDFFRPFIGGVTLDKSLETSSRSFEFVMKMFSAGDAAVPAAGMQAIPDQMAADLDAGTLLCGRRVVRVISRSGVELEGGDRIEAEAVVVATDGQAAARLVKSVPPTAFNGTVCMYFAANEPPIDDAMLMLETDPSARINNAVVMSNVAPEYAPDDQALVSATVLGEPQGSIESLVEEVRTEFSSWFGPVARSWRHLASYPIAEALPTQPSGALDPVARSVIAGDGVFVCGDHRHHASIHGALESGRAAAVEATSYIRGSSVDV